MIFLTTHKTCSRGLETWTVHPWKTAKGSWIYQANHLMFIPIIQFLAYFSRWGSTTSIKVFLEIEVSLIHYICSIFFEDFLKIRVCCVSFWQAVILNPLNDAKLWLPQMLLTSLPWTPQWVESVKSRFESDGNGLAQPWVSSFCVIGDRHHSAHQFS